MSYVLQRLDGRYLTSGYLQWSEDIEDAQRCGREEAEDIRAWLKPIGVDVILEVAPRESQRERRERLFDELLASKEQ